MVSCVALGDRLFEFRGLASSQLFCGFLGVRGLASLALCLCPLPDVDAFYWTVLAPEIVNSRWEEQGSASV